MKPLLFILSGLLIITVACKKDLTTTIGNSKQACTLNKITYWNGLLPMDVTVDSLGNIIKYGDYHLVKSGDSMLFKISPTVTYWYILYDNLGRPIQYKSVEGYSYELTYNNTKEQPQKIVYKNPINPGDLTMILTYNNNNVSQINWSHNGQHINFLVDYYLNKTNTLAKSLKLLVPGWKLDTQLPYVFATLFSQNLVKSTTAPNSGPNINYYYEFDSIGNITQTRILLNLADSVVTDYRYTCK